MNRPHIVYQALWAMAALLAAQMGAPECLVLVPDCAEKGLCRKKWSTAFLWAFAASLGLPMADGPVLWDGISNETAKVGSSDLCMLVDTLQPKASARRAGRGILTSSLKSLRASRCKPNIDSFLQSLSAGGGGMWQVCTPYLPRAWPVLRRLSLSAQHNWVPTIALAPTQGKH